MKLSKIYSTDPRFNNICFNDNFNVILGHVSNLEDLNKDSHNLGKSTLIDLIDFLLLKDIGKKHFLKKSQFSGHYFYLEIKLNSGKYVTIRRGVDKSSKINMAVHLEGNQDYRKSADWTYEELALGSSDEYKNPKAILNKLLNFDVLKGEIYRKTSGYFLRTQDDYKDVFKLQKYQGKDVQWKPILFELLGFNSDSMINKYNIEMEVSDKEKLIEQVKSEFDVDSGEKDRINGLINIAESEKDKIISWLDKFDFFQKEQNLSKEAVDKVENKISSLNTVRYNLEYEISQIKQSLEAKTNYNFADILEIYREVEIYFPDELTKSYEELIEFNNKLSTERLKYLSESLKHKMEEVKAVNKELEALNSERTQMLSVLKETDTFDKYNQYRNDLIEIERKIERYRMELESIDNVKKIQKEINALNERLTIETEKLSTQIDESTLIYKSIRNDFHEYVNYILEKNAMISIVINTNGNVEFDASFYNTLNEETAQGLGHTYRKLLCACFDLAVIKNYMNKSFYRFIYHDGCLESLDPRKRVKYLQLVKSLSQKYNIQYILTTLSSDIPQNITILPEDIAVELTDAEDNSGRLFGFEF